MNDKTLIKKDEFDDMLKIIEEKFSLYMQMYEDKKIAFENFDKFSFYDVQYLYKIIDKDYHIAYSIDDKIFENVIEYFYDIIGVKLKSNYSNNSYPHSTLYCEDYINVNFKIKEIRIRTSDFDKYILVKRYKELKNYKPFPSTIKEWISSFEKHKIKNYLYYIFKKKNTIKIYNKLKSNNENRLKSLQSEIKSYIKHIPEKDDKINMFVKQLKPLEEYGFKIIFEPVDEEYKLNEEDLILLNEILNNKKD